jgi:hypothetical protein
VRVEIVGILLYGTTHVIDLQLESLITDPGLYFRRVFERLIGMSGCYVDDMLRCGTPEYLQSSKATSALFDATPEVLRKAKLAGVNMDHGLD